VTENRYRPEGCAAEFYPVITIPQVPYVESMGGYATLMALSVKDARAITDEGIQLHIKWVGAEPFFSQAAAQKGYLGATYDAMYAAYIGKLLHLGERRMRRIRPARNFKARFCSPPQTGTPWGEEID
jgi:hypothetical protein